MPISLQCVSIWKLNLKSTRVMFGWRKSWVANFRVVFRVKLSKHPLSVWSHATVFLIGKAHVGGPQSRACCTSLCFLPTVLMFEVVSFLLLPCKSVLFSFFRTTKLWILHWLKNYRRFFLFLPFYDLKSANNFPSLIDSCCVKLNHSLIAVKKKNLGVSLIKIKVEDGFSFLYP